MSDDGSKESDLKVEDRRTSATSGDASENNSAKPPDTEEAPREDNSEAGAPGTTGSRNIPKVDFSTFVFSLFSSALIQLGDMADPVTGEKTSERNLDAASQTIDLLDLLREKTEGNLTEDETNLIKESTSQLKFKYFDAVKGKG
jgi:hypothetical protein